MVTLLRIKLTNWINVLKLLHKIEESEFSFYSDINGPFIKYLILGECYYLINNEATIGILSINKKAREIVYIPIKKDGISLFRLIHLLNIDFNLKGYTLPIVHKKLNPKLYSSYFPIQIKDNYKYMSFKINSLKGAFFAVPKELNTRKMLINNEEVLRVELQNKIFNNIANRRDLTLIEVYNEEKKINFIKDMCYILEHEGTAIGYGQIILNENEYFLVNFGIISEYRGRGYSVYFLNAIMEDCMKSGIEELNLCVDNDNASAIGLYEKVGFVEDHNQFIIKL